MSTAYQELELTNRTLSWAEVLDEALTMPGRMTDTYSRFHSYSFGNMVLLALQGVKEPVAGYQRWQQLGRQVRKGAQAKAILHPIKRTIEDDEGARHVVTGFKLRRSVFTVSDTEGDPLPEPEPLPDWSVQRALGALGIKQVPFDMIDGNTQGWSLRTELAVNPVAKYPLKTIVHEIGHILLGHTTADGMEEYATHRGLMEFEAEGTAYLVMHELGLDEQMDAAESRAYVQYWLQGATPPDRSIKRVFAAVTKILKAGRTAEGDEL